MDKVERLKQRWAMIMNFKKYLNILLNRKDVLERWKNLKR